VANGSLPVAALPGITATVRPSLQGTTGFFDGDTAESFAVLATFGGVTDCGWFEPTKTFPAQQAADEIVLGGHVVDPSDTTADSLFHCAAQIIFFVYGLKANQDIMFISSVRGMGRASAQFFFGGELVRTVALDGGSDVVPILIENPFTEDMGAEELAFFSLVIRLAGFDAQNDFLGYRGTDCYVV
jgi:hypothetical protein